MKKLTDQELDTLFKNAAEGYEPAFDQAAWEAMNVKMNQPKSTFWKRWMPFTLLGLMIFSGGVWVGSYLNQRTLPSTQLESDFKNKELLKQPEKTTTSENSLQAQNKEADSRYEATRVEEVATNQVNKRVNSNTADGLIIQQAPINNIGNDHSMQTDKSNPVDEAAFLIDVDKNLKTTDRLIGQIQIDSVQKLDKAEVVKDSSQSVLVQKKEEKKVPGAHSLFLRLLASPDFTSINYSSANTTGSNYAVLLDYHLSSRWTISAGGIWSMKKYSTNEEVTYGKYTADSMVGACRVLDIPINVYYRFFPESKLSFYTGVGLSSYVMLEEDYTYTFDTPSGSQDYSFYFEKKNNEWFKMLNVTAGVEYQLSPRFHLQAEPFLKAPLQGVGEWDVKLSSMGIFMGLKYKIN